MIRYMIEEETVSECPPCPTLPPSRTRGCNCPACRGQYSGEPGQQGFDPWMVATFMLTMAATGLFIGYFNLLGFSK